MISLFLSLILTTQISWANDPLDFNAELQRQSFKEFIGTYQGFSNDELGSLYIENNQLKFYYSRHGMVFIHFNIPISLEDSKSYYSTMGLLFGTDEIFYNREGHFISKTRITGNQFRKIIDVTTISLNSGTQLAITRRRNYYIRKNFFYGPWVVDTTSYIAKADTIDRKYFFFKSSISPTSFNYLSNLAQAQKPFLISAQNYFASLSNQPNDESELETDLQNKIDTSNNDATKITTPDHKPTHNEPGQVIQINDFKLKNCYNFLR